MLLYLDAADRPNKPLELTPQAASEIAPILNAGFRSTAFPIYAGGAAQRQGVGPSIMHRAMIQCSKNSNQPRRRSLQTHRQEQLSIGYTKGGEQHCTT